MAVRKLFVFKVRLWLGLPPQEFLASKAGKLTSGHSSDVASNSPPLQRPR